ncbi:hypothetical protein ACFPOG_15605 [Paenibacillus aestuarii]|uniref:Uncharacterized protein n=1 Tax=Paenibacillus aestuarii TaxID=516965 RepID=A0ABW0KA12_9BACL
MNRIKNRVHHIDRADNPNILTAAKKTRKRLIRSTARAQDSRFFKLAYLK